MATEIYIRDGIEHDLESLWKIYEYYRAETVITFRVKDLPLAAMVSKFHDVVDNEHLPYLVALNGDTVVGYTFASGFRSYMIGYAQTVEMSLFCHPEFVGRGVGGKLLKGLLERLETAKHLRREAFHEDEVVESDIKQVIAVMAIDEERMGLGLRDWYEKHGFTQVGHLKNVGFKHGRLYANQSFAPHVCTDLVCSIDTIYLQKSL